MNEQILNTSKGQLHYWRSEPWDVAEDTLFFLHGLSADHSMFQEQVACFEPAYNILVWDAPAHGKSRPFEAFHFADAAAYLREILDVNAVEQAILIGQSLGGYFAQAFIKRCPERIKGFVSIDSTPYGYSYYSKTDVWLLRQIEWMAGLYPLSWMKRATAKQVSATRAGYDNMLQMLAPYEKRELCRLLGLGYAGFLEDNCDLTIPCPVLLILGERDGTGKVRQYNRAWARQAGHPLAIIQGAAHNANVDRPQDVNTCIRDFLGTIR